MSDITVGFFRIGMKFVIPTFSAVGLEHIPLHCLDFVFLRLYFFFNSSHWYLAVICFPWLEEAIYEDFPQTVSQHSQVQQSQHDNKTIGDKLNVDSVFNNDNNKMIIVNNMKLKDSVVFYRETY